MKDNKDSFEGDFIVELTKETPTANVRRLCVTVIEAEKKLMVTNGNYLSGMGGLEFCDLPERTENHIISYPYECIKQVTDQTGNILWRNLHYEKMQ